jgi:hypothetical protein
VLSAAIGLVLVMALSFLAGQRLVLNCGAYATKYVLDHIPLVLFAIHGGHDEISCRAGAADHTSEVRIQTPRRTSRNSPASTR